MDPTYLEGQFNILWEKYPKKLGRKAAWRHFKASVKTTNDVDAIYLALKHYLASERVYKKYIQNGATWFNNWRDWVDYEEEMCLKCKGTGKFVSTTGYDNKCSCPKGRSLV